MCEVMQVARSSYYAFARPRAKRCTPPELLEAMRRIHHESRRSYGSRRMSLELRQRGYVVGRYRTRSLMRQAHLELSKRCAPPYRKAKEEGHIAPNLLDRQFKPKATNLVWAGDITYLKTKQGWSYLAIVMDLYSRQIVGWAIDTKVDTDLVIQALQQARERRGVSRDVMFHSDQGCQYTSARFVDDLKENKMVQSMSEWIGKQEYENHEQAKSDVAEFIEKFYNCKRLHSAANNLPPAVYDASIFVKSPL